MSTTTATRVPRFAPPAEPTRKPMPRRRTSGAGASVVGRGDRPVLRIVGDSDRAPVVVRVAPVVQRPSAVELTETVAEAPRRVDVSAFFAAEYDGDDQAVQLLRPRPGSVRLTRRGRVVLLGAALAAVLGLGVVAAARSLASDQPQPTRVVTVQPGQTLWDIATSAAGRSGGGDVRSMMSHLEAVNHLDSTSLQVGQRLRVPR